MSDACVGFSSAGLSVFVMKTARRIDAHRDNGKRFVVRADEKMTAFLELEAAIGACGELA